LNLPFTRLNGNRLGLETGINGRLKLRTRHLACGRVAGRGALGCKSRLLLAQESELVRLEAPGPARLARELYFPSRQSFGFEK
jgi:hypothetical protein